MWPLIASTVLKGAGGLVNYLINRRNIKNMPSTPKFGSSDYGQYLQNQAQTGIYSPLAQQNIINQTSQRASDIAANAKTGYMGRMINRNLGNSIAAQRGMNEMDRGVLDTVANAQTGLTTANEMSKIDAAKQFQQMQWQNKLQRYQDALNKKMMQGQNLSQFVGGMADTVSGGIDEGMLMSILGKRFGNGMGEQPSYSPMNITGQDYSQFSPNLNLSDYFRKNYNRTGIKG